MKKELVDKWVTALKSGKYTQGQGRLRDIDNNFCCLGVLCDIIDNTQWIIDSRPVPRGYDYLDYAWATLPNSLCEEIDLLDQFQYELMAMNDSGTSFDKIAEAIELHFELQEKSK